MSIFFSFFFLLFLSTAIKFRKEFENVKRIGAGYEEKQEAEETHTTIADKYIFWQRFVCCFCVRRKECQINIQRAVITNARIDVEVVL